MSIDWAKITQDYFNELPHPLEPALKVGEFATAVKLASAARFGGHASPAEAALFWPEFKATGMSPQEFEHALDRLAPLSYTYHGRPPSMQEIVKLKDEPPAKARSYFADLPHKYYPHVSAGDMVKALVAAKPHAQEHLGRDPVLPEAAYFHHSGKDPADYYSRIAHDDQPSGTLPANNVLPLKVGGDAGNSGMANVGR